MNTTRLHNLIQKMDLKTEAQWEAFRDFALSIGPTRGIQMLTSADVRETIDAARNPFTSTHAAIHYVENTMEPGTRIFIQGVRGETLQVECKLYKLATEPSLVLGRYPMQLWQGFECLKAFLLGDYWRLPITIAKSIARDWGAEKMHFTSRWCPERCGQYSFPRDLPGLIQKCQGRKQQISDELDSNDWMIAYRWLEVLEGWAQHELEAKMETEKQGETNEN